jgi:hypothetical protein
VDTVLRQIAVSTYVDEKQGEERCEMSDKIISQYPGDSKFKRNNLEIPIPNEAV